ncbi:hypothetical protein BCAH1134_2331 [Bacillus cereus AH1134]|nr:hypothetical protein BCAH1134_2331 [Bacillus cereus AH1134]
MRYICKINKVYPNYRELKKLRDISLQKAKLNKKDTCIKTSVFFIMFSMQKEKVG